MTARSRACDRAAALRRSAAPGSSRRVRPFRSTATVWGGSMLARSLIAGAVAAVIALPLVPIAGGLAWIGPWLHQRRAVARSVVAIVDELPDVVDLLALAVGSGLNVSLAVGMVARRAPPHTAAALDVVLNQVARGARLADALDALPRLMGEPVRPLVAALTAAERYGMPLLPALEGVALEVRLDRRRRAEEAVRRIPVTLLFPLVTCVLPAFALLTVAPLIAGSLGALHN